LDTVFVRRNMVLETPVVEGQPFYETAVHGLIPGERQRFVLTLFDTELDRDLVVLSTSGLVNLRGAL
jgi:hypothetical protein